jgi:hypothetical protein
MPRGFASRLGACRFGAISLPLGIALVTLAAQREAQATEIQLAVGAAGTGSEWQGDGAAYGTGRLGVRIADLVSIYTLEKLGYSAVDQRVLTFLSLGAQVYGRIDEVRPYGRVAVAHQHEESIQVVEEDPAGVLVGTGDGIRHRAGGELAAGADVPLLKEKDYVVVGSGELMMSYFPDPRGPAWYFGGAVALGIDYDI